MFGLAVGPYGALFALAWDRDKKLGHGQSTLLLLHENPSEPSPASRTTYAT